MICDGEDGIISLRYRELRDKFQCNSFEWKCFWFGVDGVDSYFGGSSIDLMVLAFCTFTDVFCSFFLQLGPPVIPFQKVYGSVYPQMSIYWGIVV